MSLVILVPSAGASWTFYRARGEARRFALAAPAVREARLTGDGSELLRRLPWFLPAFGLLGAAALYLRANWDRIPERLPIHWGIDGRPSGWSHRTPAGVYGPLLLV